MNTRVTANPVASALVYSQEIDATFEHIFGIKPTSATRKTSGNAKSKKPGVFGPPHCFVAVHETNGKGFMHTHILLNSGLPSWVIQTIGGFNGCDINLHNGRAMSKELQDALGLYIDACVQAKLKIAPHVSSLLRQLFAMKPYPAPWHVNTRVLESTNPSQVKLDFPFTIIKSNVRFFCLHRKEKKLFQRCLRNSIRMSNLQQRAQTFTSMESAAKKATGG